MRMGMCMCAAWLGDMPTWCLGMAKSLATPLKEGCATSFSWLKGQPGEDTSI